VKRQIHFHNYEVPVAYSMIKLARQSSKETLPFQEFIFYWIAFNNIYATISDRKGKRAHIQKKNGEPKFRQVGEVKMAAVQPVTERKQIELVIRELTDILKDELILHESTRYFVYRTPILHGRKIKRDALGQELNGVINIGKTANQEYPVWSPINRDFYEAYIRGKRDKRDRDNLAQQIVILLYTIRNNLFHGGKRQDDGNSSEVVEKATPLLRMIVLNFLVT
jgi:hypothetical protein